MFAIFAHALGFERLEYELSADAIALGLDAALPPVMELKGKVAEFGRGERRQTTLRHLDVPASLQLKIEVTGTDPFRTGLPSPRPRRRRRLSAPRARAPPR